MMLASLLLPAILAVTTAVERTGSVQGTPKTTQKSNETPNATFKPKNGAIPLHIPREGDVCNLLRLPKLTANPTEYMECAKPVNQDWAWEGIGIWTKKSCPPGKVFSPVSRSCRKAKAVQRQYKRNCDNYGGCNQVYEPCQVDSCGQTSSGGAWTGETQPQWVNLPQPVQPCNNGYEDYDCNYPQPIIEPTRPQPIIEPYRPQPIIEPYRPQPIIEPYRPQPIIEPTRPQPIIEPYRPQPIIEPYRPQPIIEPYRPQPIIEPYRPQPIIEPYRPQPIIEPVRPTIQRPYIQRPYVQPQVIRPVKQPYVQTINPYVEPVQPYVEQPYVDPYGQPSPSVVYPYGQTTDCGYESSGYSGCNPEAYELPVIAPRPCPVAPTQVTEQEINSGAPCSWMSAPLVQSQQQGSDFYQCQPTEGNIFCGQWQQQSCGQDQVFHPEVQVCAPQPQVQQPYVQPTVAVRPQPIYGRNPQPTSACGQGQTLPIGQCNIRQECPGSSTCDQGTGTCCQDVQNWFV